MAFITDNAFDQGLNYLDTNGTRIDISGGSIFKYYEQRNRLKHRRDEEAILAIIFAIVS